MKMPQPPQNVLSPADVRALAALADFEAVKSEAAPARSGAAASGWAGSSIASSRPCRSSAALPAALHGLPLAAARRPRCKSATHRRARAQRARQYRGGGQAHPALRRRPRDHLRRGPFAGRHLGGDRARGRRLSATTTSRRCGSPEKAKATRCLPASMPRAAMC